MKISVSVPCSRPDTVAETIHSIVRQSWQDWELIVSSQGPLGSERTEAIRKAVQGASNDKRIKHVHKDERGAARARNAGMLAATGDILAFVDDDCEADVYWLATIASIFEEDPSVELVGGALIAPPKNGFGFAVCPSNNPSESIYEPRKMNGNPPEGWDWISSNVAFRRVILEKVGLWDEYLGAGTDFPAAEDTDYLLRAEAADIKMATTPRAKVTHTYGYRYNRDFFKHIRNYSYGNGALAAKLTMMGDPRGESWYEQTKRDRLVGWLWPFRPDKGVRGFFGWRLFSSAYARCMAEYKVEGDLLKLKDGS